MENSIEMGTNGDVEQLVHLYDELNDYLSLHTNYPGWRKGIYPTRETAKEAVEEGTLYVARAEGRIAGTIILRSEPEPADGFCHKTGALQQYKSGPFRRI